MSDQIKDGDDGYPEVCKRCYAPSVCWNTRLLCYVALKQLELKIPLAKEST